ncbi:DUF7347 domain-containing protein [Natrialba asiatica]|uniref:Citrate synthase n=1 Tax=Natrialba asiatica (strain ATCC 700177 / DSM 12278 / JCM 9576 / FERM P-10747 / NBRC 102637 / 172P1) TaxID=29540 RepID=M0AVS8_NATA1|nr:hypothetical protein [Natrialba asiatica]ELZ02645.1 citrate synthase [Natrialba asiatica DSM 12278]
MAIPHWLCSENHAAHEPSTAERSLEANEIETVTDALAVLSNTIRLEILTVLYNRSEPISYTTLRESASIEDKGKFNYHLRRLDGFGLLYSDNGTYSLSQRGETLTRDIIEAQALRD